MKESLNSWNSYIAELKGSYTAPHHAVSANAWENQSTTPNGPILGNGDMRVVLLGDKNTQEFCISKSDMWTDEDSRKNVRAITTGGITIRPGEQASAQRSAFLQEQYFWDAAVHAVSEAGFETDAFVAATDNIMFLTIYNKGTEPFPLCIDVWVKEDNSCFPVSCGFQQGLLWVSRETGRAPRGNQEPVRWVSTSAIAARFLDCEGNAFQVSKGKAEMEIEIPPRHPPEPDIPLKKS